MRNIGKISLAVAMVAGASAASAGVANGDLEQLRLRLMLHDGSCMQQAEELFDEGATLPDVEYQIRLRLRDGTCLADGDGDGQKLRLRLGEDKGKGAVTRNRDEGGSGGSRN